MGFLLRGLAGHPLHPPLTDATIGLYTFAAGAAFLSWLGVSSDNLATAWWLALVGGLIVTAPTALTGFADWLTISRGTSLWRTATLHLSAMLTATVVFATAAGAGHEDYVDSTVGGGSLVLTLIGYGVMALGGWLGGAIVFVHGMRVRKLVEEATARTGPPAPHPEEEEAGSAY